MKKTKDKNIFRESDSKKNIFLWPQLLLSLLLSELQPIFLLRNSSNISRKVSRPAVGAVGSAQTQLCPHSSL